MEAILDFSKPVDVGLIDMVVNTLYNGVGPQVIPTSHI